MESRSVLDAYNSTSIGSPPEWTPTSSLDRLLPDSGSYFRDQNAARYAVHVFQPALEAILKQNSKFDFSNIDIVACGSTLGNLRRFVSEENKEFRFVVEAVGSAVFLVRRENSPTQTISDVFGYGHTFPEANTTWGSDVRGSESHQRILKYKFADLSCLVRYEGDGYLPKLHQPHIGHGKSAAATPDDLMVSLEETMVSSATVSHAGKALTVELGGEIVPQSAMFDLKTRTSKKEYEDVLKGELPRLWLAQVPNFVIGFHKNGVFDDVRVEDVREEVRQWEKDEESNLQKLTGLIKMLIAFAHGQVSGTFEVVYRGGSLELREVGGVVNSCIPDEMKRRWTQGTFDETRNDRCNARWKGRVVIEEEEEEEEDEEGKRESGAWSGDSDSEKDFTACSAASCGHCGHCGY
jgi:hypothetical protein